MSNPLVMLNEASKFYGEAVKTYALRNVNLQVNAGEFASILGPSGSGKSTLLNLLGALDRPSEGEVQIDGTPLSGLNAVELAKVRQKHLGFIFQFHYLLPDFTALENVLMPSWVADGSASEADVKEAELLLDRVGLGGRFNSKPSQLSGGQQQRVAIARALARRRSLILADEPTGNLDTKNGREAFALMREFNQERGITFLIVTHDTRLALQTDRVIEIVDGEISYDGPTSQYKA